MTKRPVSTRAQWVTVLVAAAVEDGYQRTIILPTTLDGYGYSIANTATAFTLTLQDGTTYSREIPIVTGNFWAPGNNTICKVGGELRLNNPC